MSLSKIDSSDFQKIFEERMDSIQKLNNSISSKLPVFFIGHGRYGKSTLTEKILRSWNSPSPSWSPSLFSGSSILENVFYPDFTEDNSIKCLSRAKKLLDIDFNLGILKTSLQKVFEYAEELRSRAWNYCRYGHHHILVLEKRECIEGFADVECAALLQFEKRLAIQQAVLERILLVILELLKSLFDLFNFTYLFSPGKIFKQEYLDLISTYKEATGFNYFFKPVKTLYHDKSIFKDYSRLRSVQN